jgi:protease IV
MKKVTGLLQIIILLSSFSVYSQDFYLYTPSSETYMFSSYDENGHAYRLNPAVLGLKHKFNLSLSSFVELYQGKPRLNEYDLSINSGIFGLSYRAVILDRTTEVSMLHTFSLGFGFGTKSYSFGLVGQSQTLARTSTPDDFYDNYSRFKFGLGFLCRPYKFLSTSFVINTGEAFTVSDRTANKYTVGLGIRPLKNNMINLLIDFSVIPYYESSFFKYSALKIGAEVKYKGIGVSANYLAYSETIKNQMINIGFSFNLPHSSIKYNNTLTKTDNGTYSSSYPYKTQGSLITLNYFGERRESIVPEGKKILEVSLSGSLQDYNTEDVLFGMFGEGKKSIHETIADIDYATNDPSIKGLIIKIYPLTTGMLDVNAKIEEITFALERFKKRNKTITAYIPQDAGPAEYYIASYANKIVMPEQSMLFYGLSMDVINYKQFLEKYGIELQTLYAGKYKLTFQGLLDSTTKEGKEVINRILDVIYNKMLARIYDGRNLSVDEYLKTKLSQPITGKEAKRLGLVDFNGWYETAKDEAEKSSKLEGRFTCNLNRNVWDEGWSEPEEIAIIGIYGSITSGKSEPPSPIQLPIPFLSSGRSTGSESVVKQLEDAFSNPKVKVVILRVDSGGGSALASAEINDAIKRLKKKYKKLFLVSMGGAAASGGYYVSVNADKIFSDNLTITGSIGVWSAKPNIDSLLNDQKIKVETFKRGEFSDINSPYRSFTDAEKEILQNIVNYYYDGFVKEVSEGRKLTKEQVDEIAQGRVWLGSDAYNKKLVDQIGGLFNAVSYAKKKTKLTKRYKLVYYPVPGGETVSEIMTKSAIDYIESKLLDLIGISDDDNIEVKY